MDFDGGLGGEAEETALFLPVMRQVFAQSQQPARRQRVGLTAREERAHDFRAEIGQPNKRSRILNVYRARDATSSQTTKSAVTNTISRTVIGKTHRHAKAGRRNSGV